jgi:RNase P subunit RPR2
MTSIPRCAKLKAREVKSHHLVVTCDECGKDITGRALEALDLKTVRIRRVGIRGKYTHTTHTCAKCRLVESRLKQHIYTLRTLER